MIVGIHQPNYLPWLGYFRKIAQCDLFVFFDNVQAPGGKSFVYRNRVKTPSGPLWLSVPVERGGTAPAIADVRIADRRWVRKHLRTLETSYAHARWHGLVGDLIEPILSAGHQRIADLNVALVEAICGAVGLSGTRFERATSMALRGTGAETIPEILERSGASVYLTGAGAGSLRHLDAAAFDRAGVEVRFLSTGFPEYPQAHGAFEPGLSAVDALLNCGPEGARRLIEGEPAAG